MERFVEPIQDDIQETKREGDSWRGSCDIVRGREFTSAKLHSLVLKWSAPDTAVTAFEAHFIWLRILKLYIAPE